MDATTQKLINAIDDDVETLATLGELAPLLGNGGVEYLRHAIVVLEMIGRVACRLETTVAELAATLQLPPCR